MDGMMIATAQTQRLQAENVQNAEVKTMESLNTIIEELKQTCKKYGMNDISQETVLEQAVKIMLHEDTSRLGSLNRKVKAAEEHPADSDPGEFNHDRRGEPATDKQKYVLLKAGVDIPDGITKLEASKIIKEMKEAQYGY
jgi:hypothetical protein